MPDKPLPKPAAETPGRTTRSKTTDVGLANPDHEDPDVVARQANKDKRTSTTATTPNPSTTPSDDPTGIMTLTPYTPQTPQADRNFTPVEGRRTTQFAEAIPDPPHNIPATANNYYAHLDGMADAEVADDADTAPAAVSTHEDANYGGETSPSARDGDIIYGGDDDDVPDLAILGGDTTAPPLDSRAMAMKEFATTMQTKIPALDTPPHDSVRAHESVPTDTMATSSLTDQVSSLATATSSLTELVGTLGAKYDMLEAKLVNTDNKFDLILAQLQTMADAKKADTADLDTRIANTVDGHLASSLAPKIEGILATKIGDIDTSLSQVTSMHGEVLKHSNEVKSHAARNKKESADIVLLAAKERQSITNATQASILRLEKESTKLEELRRDAAAAPVPEDKDCPDVTPPKDKDCPDDTPPLDPIPADEAMAPPPRHGAMFINGERAASRQIDPTFAINPSPDPITHLFNTYPAAVEVEQKMTSYDGGVTQSWILGKDRHSKESVFVSIPYTEHPLPTMDGTIQHVLDVERGALVPLSVRSAEKDSSGHYVYGFARDLSRDSFNPNVAAKVHPQARSNLFEAVNTGADLLFRKATSADGQSPFPPPTPSSHPLFPMWMQLT